MTRELLLAFLGLGLAGADLWTGGSPELPVPPQAPLQPHGRLCQFVAVNLGLSGACYTAFLCAVYMYYEGKLIIQCPCAKGEGKGCDVMLDISVMYTEAGYNQPRSQGLFRFSKGPGNEIDDGGEGMNCRFGGEGGRGDNA